MSKQNKDLFKNAIAEAKQIREAALLNAKASIEEAFTPKIQEMFDAKLSEMEDEDQALDVSPQGEEDLDEDFDLSSILAELDEEDGLINENAEEEGLDEKKEKDDDKDDVEDDDKEKDDDKDSKPKSKTPAKPKAPSEPKEPKTPGLEGEEDEDLDVSDLSVKDLVKLVKDIIAQETSGTADDSGIDLDDDSLESGSPDDLNAPNDDPFGSKPKPSEPGLGDDDNEDLDEDFNLEELLGELDSLNEDDEDYNVSGMNELKAELNEALKVIKIQNKAIIESNLITAKLRGISTILKEGQLNNDQKTKVIAAFDKAKTQNEVKLVFESLKTNISLRKPAPIKESLFRNNSSRPIGIAPKRSSGVVDVDSQMKRMQKLANIG